MRARARGLEAISTSPPTKAVTPPYRKSLVPLVPLGPLGALPASTAYMSLPRSHQFAPAFECVRPPVSPLHLTAGDVRERGLG
jgi:hypothetical protein